MKRKWSKADEGKKRVMRPVRGLRTGSDGGSRHTRRVCAGVLLGAVLSLGAAMAMGGLPQPSEWFVNADTQAQQEEGSGRDNGELSAEKAAALAAAGQAPAISASTAILIDAKDGTVLFESGADEKQYPASTTKIMTALVALDVCEELEVSLDSEVSIPAEAQGVEGSSLYLKAGERVSLEELLHGLMLQSGNDAAVALAYAMGGNTDAFVALMNEKAAELGCTGTHFCNPNGLYDENHYTTARDLSTIARKAMENEDFRRIVAAKKWSSSQVRSQNDDAALRPGQVASPARTFVNKNKTVFQYDGGSGVKIGFTKASGRTLVASAERGGNAVIAVVLRAPDWFRDAYALMDYGFSILESAGQEDGK